MIRMQRNFLWGGEAGCKKIARVKWKNVCKPKECGGIGIKNVFIFNEAFLAKWRLNLMSKEALLWSDVLIAKYDGWCGLTHGNQPRGTSLKAN